ncbi:hypothetical protein J3E69DRAFT_367256 [Trichoderma sp. SZMC 28015]
MTPSSPVLGAANIAQWILRSQALLSMGHLKSAPTGHPWPSRTTKRELRDDSPEPIDLERDRAVGTKPSAPKKQRTADGPSGIAIQPDSVDGENGAAAGFCLTCVKRMSQGIFDGENLSLKKPADVRLSGREFNPDQSVERHGRYLRGGRVPGPLRKHIQGLPANAPHAKSAYQLTSNTKARKAAIDFATQCIRWYTARGDIRKAASVFTQLQGSYADYMTQFKSACSANNQLLHDKTIRKAATHFRSIKIAQISRNRYQARLDDISIALQTLIRPSIP